MPRHESVCVFYKKQPIYNPQKQPREDKNKRNNKKTRHTTQELKWVLCIEVMGIQI